MSLLRTCTRPAVLLLLVISTVKIHAQISGTIKDPGISQLHSFWVQYLPSALLEPEVPVAATFLYKINQRTGLGLDAGFFVAKQDYSGNGLHRYGGFLLKPAVRYYLKKNHNEPRGIYISLQGIIKRTIDNKQEWNSRFDSLGQVVFSQQADYKERKLVLGLNFIFGGELFLDRKRSWMVDFYAGPGIRNKYFKAIGLPPGVVRNYDRADEGRVFDIYTNGTYISLSAGIKIGYRIK